MIRLAEEALARKERNSFKTQGYIKGKNDGYFLKEKQIINEEYEQEIKAMLKHKNYDELQKLEDEINESLQNKDFTMDIEYWDQILKKVDYYKARLKLKEFNNAFIEKNQDRLYVNPEKYPTNIKIIEENDDVGDNSPYLLEFGKELENLAITEEDNLFDIQEERKKVLENEMSNALSALSKNLKKTKQDQKNEKNKKNERIEIDDPNNGPENSIKIVGDEEGNDRAVAEQIMNFEKSKPLKPNEEKFDDLVEIKKVCFFLILTILTNFIGFFKDL